VKRGDVCYGMLRAAACVDESDHHALMYVWHGHGLLFITVILLQDLGLTSGFESPDLDRLGRLSHQQGLCEARLGCQDESPQLGPPGPDDSCQSRCSKFF